MFWHLASSSALRADRAAQELAGQLKPQARLCLVLCSHDYSPHELASVLNPLLAPAPWLGMAVQALQVGSQNLSRGIVIAQFLHPDLQVGLSQLLPADTPDRLAGQLAARQALDELGHSQADTLIFFAEPHAGSASAILFGALEEAGSGPAWIGGGTGHAYGPGFLLLNGQVCQGPVVIAALRHKRPWRTAVAQGWIPSGASATVTSSHRLLLRELDYLPARVAYAEMARRDGLLLDPDRFTDFARSHPLGIPLGSGHYLLRLPLGCHTHGALNCAAEMPPNSLVQLMTGHGPSLCEAAAQAAARVRLRSKGLDGALAFYDAARLEALGPYAEKERAALLRELRQIPWLGAVCIGQVGSFGGVPHYHNQAVALLGVGG